MPSLTSPWSANRGAGFAHSTPTAAQRPDAHSHSGGPLRAEPANEEAIQVGAIDLTPMSGPALLSRCVDDRVPGLTNRCRLG